MINNDFSKLAAIVCRNYCTDTSVVLGRSHKHRHTTPRNIIAAIWSRGATLSETAELVGWKSPQQVCHARDRVTVLSQRTAHAHRLKMILEDLNQELPWLVAGDSMENETSQSTGKKGKQHE